MLNADATLQFPSPLHHSYHARSPPVLRDMRQILLGRSCVQRRGVTLEHWGANVWLQWLGSIGAHVPFVSWLSNTQGWWRVNAVQGP